MQRDAARRMNSPSSTLNSLLDEGLLPELVTVLVIAATPDIDGRRDAAAALCDPSRTDESTDLGLVRLGDKYTCTLRVLSDDALQETYALRARSIESRCRTEYWHRSIDPRRR